MSKDHRIQGRSNVFLGATVEAGSQRFPVRVRNVSVGGALIEAALLPKLGARVQLVRGQLSMTGVFAWQSGDQAGITFDQPIDVSAWVKRGGAPGQNRVDTIVAALRKSDRIPAELLTRDAMSLTEISVALDALCERLAGMDDIPANFGEELLTLDSLAQALRKSATGKAFR